MPADRYAALDDLSFEVCELLGEAIKLLFDLEGEFTGVHQHERVQRRRVVHALKNGEHEHCSFSLPGFGLAQNIHA